MRRTTGFGTAGRTRAIAWSISAIGAPILRVDLAALELEHQPAQDPVQQLLLLLRESGRDQRLLLRLHGDSARPGVAPLVGELDLDRAAVARVGHAAHEPRLLEAVETVGHRAA